MGPMLITTRLVTAGTIIARIKSRRHIALQLCTTWLLYAEGRQQLKPTITNSEAGDCVTNRGAIV